MSITFQIAPYVDGQAVDVTFTCAENGFVHHRKVNAVFDESDAYDEAATIARVGEVALGVEVKMNAGAFKPVEPEPLEQQEIEP